MFFRKKKDNSKKNLYKKDKESLRNWKIWAPYQASHKG